MSLRFFCDHCVPRGITERLRKGGHEVLLLKECLPIRSPDTAVIAKARELGCILVSLNGDFADIAAYPPEDYAGIFSVQVRNHPEIIPALMARLEAFLAANPAPNYYRGKLFVVEVHRVRIRE